jgi:hypothetical protein
MDPAPLGCQAPTIDGSPEAPLHDLTLRGYLVSPLGTSPAVPYMYRTDVYSTVRYNHSMNRPKSTPSRSTA